MPQTLLFETEVTRTFRLPYLLYLPAGDHTSGSDRWPFILFLHGAGERGDDLEAVRAVGLPPRIEAWSESPFIVAAPQCPAHSDWLMELDAVEALLDHLVSEYPVDPKRIYLTGMSMGGRGAWQLAARNLGRFAAIAPVCGRRPVGLSGIEDVPGLKDLPAWVFHGSLDEVIPPGESEFMVELLRSHGEDVRHTVFPNTEHDSWNEAYDTEELFSWFLEHTSG
ncbi:MAG TPA: prolyl oligopeptidase family serine peptidase [Anaerolineales bacterium]|nr:prolyl oligopeptidase family serine peptidase [Anaerolineales bacterium]